MPVGPGFLVFAAKIDQTRTQIAIRRRAVSCRCCVRHLRKYRRLRRNRVQDLPAWDCARPASSQNPEYRLSFRYLALAGDVLDEVLQFDERVGLTAQFVEPSATGRGMC